MMLRVVFLYQLLACLFLLLPGVGFEPADIQAEGCTAPE